MDTKIDDAARRVVFFDAVRKALQVALALGGIYIIQFEAWPGQLTSIVFWGLALLIFFLGLEGLVARSIGVLFGILALASAGIALSTYWNQSRIVIFGPNTLEIAAGSFAILATMLASWRLNGPPLAVLACAFIVFAFLGSALPPGIGHIPINLEMLVNHLFVTAEGLFGLPLNVVVHVLIIFVMFSAFLERSGASEAIVLLANKLVGRSTGGPGKVAVLASSFFGMITGAAVANVVASGVFSIPMMKKAGYRGSQAAAIESVASTGSQIAPPVLGSAAFIMAEFLGISYLSIVAAAIIPALIYYGTLFFGVHALGAAQGVQPLPPSVAGRRNPVREAMLLMPLLVLIVAMVGFGFTPPYAGLLAVASVPILSIASGRGIMRPGAILGAFRRTGEMIQPLIVLTACAGLIIGVFSLTGIGQKLVSLVAALSGGNLFVVMVLAMLASIVLGMGLPTVAVYIVLALTVAPVMVQNGVEPLIAHFFILYYGALSAITPPVALATIAAASIAEANLWRAGYEAVRLALVAYIMPFFFVSLPGLFLIGGGYEIAHAVLLVVPLSAGVVVAAFGFAKGRLAWPMRLVFLGSSLLIMSGNTVGEVLGVFAVLGLLAYRYSRSTDSI